MSASVQSIISTGFGGMFVDIERRLSNRRPDIIIVDFANKSDDEAKERPRGAFANSNTALLRQRLKLTYRQPTYPQPTVALTQNHSSYLSN
jgi:hypothetical protein